MQQEIEVKIIRWKYDMNYGSYFSTITRCTAIYHDEQHQKCENKNSMHILIFVVFEKCHAKKCIFSCGKKIAQKSVILH